MGILNLAKLEMPKKEDEPIGSALTKGFQALAKKKTKVATLKSDYNKSSQKSAEDSESKSYQASDEDSMA